MELKIYVHEKAYKNGSIMFQRESLFNVNPSPRPTSNLDANFTSRTVYPSVGLIWFFGGMQRSCGKYENKDE